MASTHWEPNRYPPARRETRPDTYDSETRGKFNVQDPYRWLETNSEETQAWIESQNKLTRDFLDQNPDKKPFEDEIRKAMDYPKVSSPDLKGDGRWYWYANSGLQPQIVIWRSLDEKVPEISAGMPSGEVFFDPNLLSADGTAALSATRFSKDGKYLAYGISRSGSDFYTVYIRPTSKPFASKGAQDVSHDDDRLQDEIRFVKFSSISWTHDTKGFFYQRYPTREFHGNATSDVAGTETVSDTDAMLFYHRIGTQQSEDILVYQDASHPDWFYGAEVTEEDGRYLVLSISRDTARKNMLWITDLEKNPIGHNMGWDKLIDEFDAAYDYIANDGPVFYFHTNKDAPLWKVVSVDISKPPHERVFKEIIPEQKANPEKDPQDRGATLEEVHAFAQDKFAVKYKRNVIDEIYVYDMNGKCLTRVGADAVGTADLSSHRGQPWFWATLSDFTTPGRIMLYDTSKADENARWSQWYQTETKGLNREDFRTIQVWYPSADGTRIPMFIVRHKDTKFDGTAPAIQYGYGGFNISIDPFFSASMLTFLQRYGAILAVPNIRGGGEFGDEWHEGGILEKKVNCFDDFIAATKFLVGDISETVNGASRVKYAARGKVIINGGSNGGLLVAACVQRAEEGLIGCAISEVGVHDLLKYADFTIGRAWVADYGDPHNPHDFDFIYPISPVHNVPTNKVLPPTLLLTADHDDRVVPLHSFKLAAAYQYAAPHNPHPLLIRIDTKSGHGAGKSTEKRITEAADKWGFAVQTLGLRPRNTPRL